MEAPERIVLHEKCWRMFVAGRVHDSNDAQTTNSVRHFKVSVKTNCNDTDKNDDHNYCLASKQDDADTVLRSSSESLTRSLPTTCGNIAMDCSLTVAQAKTNVDLAIRKTKPARSLLRVDLGGNLLRGHFDKTGSASARSGSHGWSQCYNTLLCAEMSCDGEQQYLTTPRPSPC